MEFKVIHALSLTAAFVIAAMGLNSKWKGLTGMYSLHSWLGFGFVLIFGIQVSLKELNFSTSQVSLYVSDSQFAFIPCISVNCYHETFMLHH